MLKLRINPLVAADLKEICDYIAEDNAEYAAKKSIVNLRIFNCFPRWGQIFPKESVSEQIISMQYGEIM